MNTQYITAEQIQTVLRVGRTKAYAIVRKLNTELADMGYITVEGKCPLEYFKKKYYGFDPESVRV